MPEQNKADDSLDKQDPAVTQPVAGGGAPQGKDGDPNAISADQDPKAYIVPGDPAAEKPRKTPLAVARGIIHHINIYFLFFLLIVFTAVGILGVSTVSERTRQEVVEDEGTIRTQDLPEDIKAQLNGTETKLGDPKQLLNIESNAIFSGKVLVRDSVDIAGSLNLGGELSLPSLTVTGPTRFNQIQANGLELAQDMTISGNATVQQNLNVSGNAEFGGGINASQITVSVLTLNSDLRLAGHLDVNGNTPGVSAGTGAGGGGTASIAGNDTAGTVTINTGSNPPAGVLATISFVNAYSETPRVVITPSSSSAASTTYYVIKNNTSFSIAVATPAGTGQGLMFDYFIVQ